jgi:phage tail-like protein
MRGAVDGLRSPETLAAALPGAFFGNEFTQELIAAFDEVLAPVFVSLDDFAAYLDPRYAPEDFLRWLAGWVGFPLDERWSADRMRSRIGDAVEAIRWRGTLRGVAAAVRAYTGEPPEVMDTGGVVSSARPLGPLPGEPRPRLLVRVRRSRRLDPDVLDRIVSDVKPAHVPHEIVFA